MEHRITLFLFICNSHHSGKHLKPYSKQNFKGKHSNSWDLWYAHMVLILAIDQFWAITKRKLYVFMILGNFCISRYSSDGLRVSFLQWGQQTFTAGYPCPKPTAQTGCGTSAYLPASLAWHSQQTGVFVSGDEKWLFPLWTPRVQAVSPAQLHTPRAPLGWCSPHTGPPSWPLSVRTAHLLCWTQAFPRCKCDTDPMIRSHGGTSRWLGLFILRKSTLSLSGRLGDRSRLAVDYLPVPGTESQALCLVEECGVGWDSWAWHSSDLSERDTVCFLHKVPRVGMQPAVG